MRKSATIDMMNKFRDYVKMIDSDVAKARNGLIFVEYLLSRVEFFSQIAKDNDYYQNIEKYKSKYCLSIICNVGDPLTNVTQSIKMLSLCRIFVLLP